MQLPTRAARARGWLPARAPIAASSVLRPPRIPGHGAPPLRPHSRSPRAARSSRPLKPVHFHRQFKRSTGLTPAKCISEVRIKRAKTLLRLRSAARRGRCPSRLRGPEPLHGCFPASNVDDTATLSECNRHSMKLPRPGLCGPRPRSQRPQNSNHIGLCATGSNKNHQHWPKLLTMQ
jgi:hypothetical protein